MRRTIIVLLLSAYISSLTGKELGKTLDNSVFAFEIPDGTGCHYYFVVG